PHVRAARRGTGPNRGPAPPRAGPEHRLAVDAPRPRGPRLGALGRNAGRGGRELLRRVRTRSPPQYTPAGALGGRPHVRSTPAPEPDADLRRMARADGERPRRGAGEVARPRGLGASAPPGAPAPTRERGRGARGCARAAAAAVSRPAATTVARRPSCSGLPCAGRCRRPAALR